MSGDTFVEKPVPPDIAPEEKERVLRITAESDNEDYWFAASRDGNRETHYRGVAFGTSLYLLRCTVRLHLSKLLCVITLQDKQKVPK